MHDGPRHTTAVARPSASIILVHDAPRGLETFMVRRHARSPVAPSAYVFPGGTVRSDDQEFPCPNTNLAEALSARSDTPVATAQANAFYVCATRELFEEAGVLLARSEHGSLLEVDQAHVALQEDLAATRLQLQARECSLQAVLAQMGLQPAFDRLVPFSHWVTPDVIAARFDTRFFVAEMPPRQEALHCTIETSEGLWLRPREVLDGDYHVVYATAQHLQRLTAFATVDTLLEFACRKPIKRVHPTVTEGPSGLGVHLPSDIADSW